MIEKLKKTSSQWGPVFVAAAALLWAFDSVLRRSLYELPPLVIVFSEHAIGAMLILPMLLPYLRRISLTSKEWIAIVWVSFFSGLVGTLWFTQALIMVEFIPFSVVVLLQKLQPIFATFSAVILLKERLSWGYVKWAGMAVVAAYFVTFPNGNVDVLVSRQTIWAALFAIGAAFAWGSSTSISRYALLNQPYTLITGLRFWITALLAAIAVIGRGYLPFVFSLEPTNVIRLMLIAFSTGLFALWLYYKGLKHTQARVSTIIELLFPAVAVGIDMYLYQSVLVPTQYLAAVALVYAVYRTSGYNRS